MNRLRPNVARRFLTASCLVGATIIAIGFPHLDSTGRLISGGTILALAGWSLGREDGRRNYRWTFATALAVLLGVRFETNFAPVVFFSVNAISAFACSRDKALRSIVTGALAVVAFNAYCPSWAFHLGQGTADLVNDLGLHLGLNGVFGPTYLGLAELALLVVIQILVSLPGQNRRMVALTCARIAVAAIVWLTLAKLALNVLSLRSSDVTNWLLTLTGNSDVVDAFTFGPVYLLLSVFAWGFILFPDAVEEGTSQQPFVGWRLVLNAAGVGAVILGLVASLMNTTPANKVHNVAFYENGMQDFGVPQYGAYGSGATGMFGLWKQRLGTYGHKTAMVSKLNGSTLQEFDWLVVINPQELEPAAAQAVLTFVDRGGTLLMLLDHTDIFGTQQMANRLCAPLQCRLNFDSAEAMGYDWNGIWEITRDSRCCVQDDHNGMLRWGLGASVALNSWAWRPWIVLKYGFGDIGNRANAPSYLGDKRYQHGERMGDLVLAAERSWGRGRVIVFGDTSSFQNVAVIHSEPAVIANLFQPPATRPAWREIAGNVLLAAGVACVLSSEGFAAALFMVAAMALFGGGRNMYATAGATAPMRPGDTGTLWVDIDHAGAFNLNSFHNRSIDGLMFNGIRAGYWPGFLRDWSQLETVSSHDVLCLINPRKSISAVDLARLEGFLRRGGRVVLSAGCDESGILSSLETRFGFSITNAILGPIPIRRKMDAMEFIKTQEDLQMKEAWLLELSSNAEWKDIKEVAGHRVIAAKPVGAGRLIVISDGRFLLDENLEGEKGAWLGNVELMRRIFKAEKL